MWIRSQDGQELLNVQRFRYIPLDNADVNILAKLDRETVCIGTYSKDQAMSVMDDLWYEIRHGMIKDPNQIYRTKYYDMPNRWEDEEE